MITTYTIFVAGMDEAKKNAVWGTYGKDGKEMLKWVRLVDCSTDHLIALLSGGWLHGNRDYQEIIRSILKDRGVPGYAV